MTSTVVTKPLQPSSLGKAAVIINFAKQLYRRRSWLVEKYNVSLRKHLQQGMSEPEVYGELENLWGNLIFLNNFENLLHCNRYKRIGYNPYIMRQTACLVMNMERHNWHLMLNIYKHTTSYNMYCSYFLIRSILNIMCGSLNTLCCSFLITRSEFVIIRCRSYKWCSSLIITCCAFINCRATCYFMYSRYNFIRSIPLIIRCSRFITCCGYIFQ